MERRSFIRPPRGPAGGPIALVANGDMIELDVPNRRLHLDVSDAELEKRRARWTAPLPHSERGYYRLYTDHVMQADKGADLDFLVGSPARTSRVKVIKRRKRNDDAEETDSQIKERILELEQQRCDALTSSNVAAMERPVLRRPLLRAFVVESRHQAILHRIDAVWFARLPGNRPR